jgi:hypothetical protein
MRGFLIFVATKHIIPCIRDIATKDEDTNHHKCAAACSDYPGYDHGPEPHIKKHSERGCCIPSQSLRRGTVIVHPRRLHEAAAANVGALCHQLPLLK